MNFREIFRGKPKEKELKELSEDFVIYERNDDTPYCDKTDHLERSKHNDTGQHEKHKKKSIFHRED